MEKLATAPRSSLSPDRTSLNQPAAELTVADVFRTIRRHARWIGIMATVGLVVTAVVVLLLPRSYSSSVSFVPQSTDNSSRFSGLAAQFGISLGAAQDAADSPEFYTELLGSREILEPVATSAYQVTAEAKPQPLVDIYETDGATAAQRREAAIDELRSAVGTSIGKESGVIHFTVDARSPNLAQQLAQRIVQQLNEFNLHVRQEKAESERDFIRVRLADAESELNAAESALRSFLQRNRQYQGDPELQMEHDTYQRKVDIRQQVYTSLAQSYEQVRVDAVRNTPVIMVLERPVVPVRPKPRRLPLRAAIGAFVGALLGLAIGYFSSTREAISPR